MVFWSNTLKLLVFMLVACEPKTKIEYITIEVEKIVEVPAANTSVASSVSNSSLSISGALNLPSGSLGLAGGLGLAGDDYSLVCVTFEANPLSFPIQVTATDGALAFSGSLDDTAGVSFGCFLLKALVVKAPIVFGAASSIVTGAGDLVFDIAYNPVSKSAVAAIDEEKSTALSQAAIDAALTDKGASLTNLALIDATYKLSCLAAEGMSCDLAALPSAEIYFRHFKIDEADKVAMWTSKAKRDQCVPSDNLAASEASPAFNMNIGETSIDMNFSSDTQLKASLDGAYSSLDSKALGSLEKELAKSINQNAEDNSSWKAAQCSVLQDQNCKLVLGQMETYTWTDYQTQEVHTSSYPKWFSYGDYTSASEYSGAVTTATSPCKSYWTEGGDICPAGVVLDENKAGNFTVYFGTNPSNNVQQRLRLLCTDGSSMSHQDWAHGSDKAASLTAAEDSKGCTVITGGGPFNSKPEYHRADVHDALSNIASFALYNDSSDVCKNYDLSSAFRVTDCESSVVLEDVEQLSYVYWEAEKPSWITPEMEQNAANAGHSYVSYFARDWSVAEFCRDLTDGQMMSWGMAIDSTNKKLIDDTSTTSGMIYEYSGRHICSVHMGGVDSGTTTFDSSACLNEFYALEADEQIKRYQKKRIGPWQPLKFLACPDVSFREAVQAGMNNQCLPEVFSTWVCDGSGNCRQNLTCAGSKGGECYDSAGTFIGRIPSRFAIMDAQAGVEGAFSLTNTVSDQWMAYDFDNTEMKSCTLTNDIVFSAKMNSGFSEGTSYLKKVFQQECTATTEGEGQGGGTTAGGTMGGAGSGGNGNADNIPATDQLMKLDLERCTDHNC